MRNTNFPPRILAAALSACATESVNLNSERIEQRFGSYGIEVLASEAGMRRTSLFSHDGDSSTCRTYAVVRFAEQLDDRYGTEHSRVLAGDSIGAIFKENGWDIFKRTLHIGRTRLPNRATEIGRLMRLSGAHDLALHVYQLDLVKGEQAYEYATIMEAHHPEYLSAQNLTELYDFEPINRPASQDISALSDLLLRDSA